VPQIYDVGLRAGGNDVAAVERTGEGRAINRHDYTTAELRDALDRPGVPAAARAHPHAQHPSAFDGTLDVDLIDDTRLGLAWRVLVLARGRPFGWSPHRGRRPR
jgi:sucrose phosphorylase